GRSEPVVMPGDSAALHILQRVRDEAHRFAVSYHRKLRSKQGMASVLDEVPGIGPRRKQALLKKFGSVHALRDASPEEIGQVKGVSLALAEKIKEYL
ncbi:MAG: helix-hairpin-helix domain-containing protein, partial [Chloroflexota bacterium]|nr:helix-hairpin-helix domain-containing protein [Chloroflexota bacterium]